MQSVNLWGISSFIIDFLSTPMADNQPSGF